jgi:hypothetical protein
MNYPKGITYNKKYPAGTLIKWKVPPSIHCWQSVKITTDEEPPKRLKGRKDIVPVMTNQGLVWIKESEIIEFKLPKKEKEND